MRLLISLVFLLALRVSAADRMELVWPTPNKGWAEGKPLDAYIQHAGSGEAESGTFGGVRSGGHQFHEGIDIKCVSRDRRGEPIDDVYAALDGVVRHINGVAGDSSYGRYIVLEHPDQSPAVYTLYAHLSRIAPGLHVGDKVTHGQIIGTMGHSSDKTIPRDRAHLHFEIGVLVTRNFQLWYDRKKFGSRNDQGIWNGMNLMGLDPLAVFNGWRAGRIANMRDVFAQMTPAARVRIATHQFPDFIVRYPSLMTKPPAMGPVAGWEILVNWTGIPYSWTPLTAAEVAGLPAEQPRIIDADAETSKRQHSKSVAFIRRGSWSSGKDLDTVFQQIFGVW